MEVTPWEQCMTIKLRSGTQYDGPSMPREDDGEVREEEKESKEEEFDMVNARDEIAEKKEETNKEVWVSKWKKVREARKLKEDENVKCDDWGVPIIPFHHVFHAAS
ncbi:hypothetical protein ACS0TY_001494 [Phlomoides rotata]